MQTILRRVETSILELQESIKVIVAYFLDLNG
jgi:hypothetical protein